MNAHAFSSFEPAVAPGAPEAAPASSPAASPLAAPAWHLLPVEGRFEIVYEDRQGIWSRRTLAARELKLGPGRTLLGGIDSGRGGYRGFRVDRIRRLTDTATGERLEGGILDWLLARAEARRRLDAARIRRQTRAQARARRDAAGGAVGLGAPVFGGDA